MQATARLYNLGYTEAKSYLVAALFVMGNIALPQLFHPSISSPLSGLINTDGK